MLSHARNAFCFFFSKQKRETDPPPGSVGGEICKRAAPRAAKPPPRPERQTRRERPQQRDRDPPRSECDLVKRGNPGRAEGDEITVAERPQGRFNRQLFLGESLDSDRLEARYDDGVLSIRIPVAEQAKPRKILVDASDDRRQINA